MIRQYTITPPMNPLPGDTFAVVAGVLEQRRGGTLVAFRNLAEMDSAPLAGPQVIGNKITKFFQEVRMAVSLGIDSVTYGPGDAVTVNWSNSTSTEYGDQSALLNAATAVVNEDLAKALLLGRFLGLDSAMTNPAKINGTLVQVDLSLAINPIQFGSL